jgi:glycosyltransferase involved in cell wall biosynthesis
MKISLITVTYNSSTTLKDTIQSILSQTYSNIEYIIVDGASKDNTVEIIKQHEPLFKGRMKWISERDKGLYDAMNKGIRMATGDVIGILNSDDLFMDNKVIEDIAAAFDNQTKAIFGNLYFVDQVDINKIVRVWKGSPYKTFKSGWHPAHPTFYVRKEVYEKYGVFDTTFDVSADFELMLRLIEKNAIQTKYLDRYMVKMRMGGESTGSIKNIIKGNKNIFRAFKKNGIPVSPLYPIYRLLPKIIDKIGYMIGFCKH